MSRTLIIRLSALGDVAMTIPVVYSVANRYPQETFILVTKQQNAKLFINKPENLTVIPALTNTTHKGLRGLYRLIQETGNIDKVADLHDVLRSKLIRYHFAFRGKKVAVIDKGKKEKHALTRPKGKVRKPLTSSIERYQSVFKKLGFDAEITFTGFTFPREEKTDTLIGIAPFAAHQGKVYPPELMEKVIERLSRRPATQLYLFGGGPKEKQQLDQWADKYEHTTSLAGKGTFEEELSRMSQLDLMVSMDSANMHLASLVNTPVISIWGATHPDAGFYGFGQQPENAIQLEMDCRPCSVFGNKPCYKGDYPCLRNIQPEMIIARIENLLATQNK